MKKTTIISLLFLLIASDAMAARRRKPQPNKPAVKWEFPTQELAQSWYKVFVGNQETDCQPDRLKNMLEYEDPSRGLIGGLNPDYIAWPDNPEKTMLYGLVTLSYTKNRRECINHLLDHGASIEKLVAPYRNNDESKWGFKSDTEHQRFMADQFIGMLTVGHYKFSKKLLKMGVNPDYDNNPNETFTSLFYMLGFRRDQEFYNDRIKVLPLMVKNGASLNHWVLSGETPFFRAVSRKPPPDLIRLMLAYGANPNEFYYKTSAKRYKVSILSKAINSTLFDEDFKQLPAIVGHLLNYAANPNFDLGPSIVDYTAHECGLLDDLLNLSGQSDLNDEDNYIIETARELYNANYNMEKCWNLRPNRLRWTSFQTFIDYVNN